MPFTNKKKKNELSIEGIGYNRLFSARLPLICHALHYRALSAEKQIHNRYMSRLTKPIL